MLINVSNDDEEYGEEFEARGVISKGLLVLLRLTVGIAVDDVDVDDEEEDEEEGAVWDGGGRERFLTKLNNCKRLNIFGEGIITGSCTTLWCTALV